MKKSNIILAGVGGQGILTIAASISLAALEENMIIKQAEVHGMSQRGGAVQSHLRVSETNISSDLIPKGAADLILSVEPIEALRYLPYLKQGGMLIANSTPFINIDDYPDTEEIYREINNIAGSIIIDAEKIAKDLGSPRSSNIVMLGAASPYICLGEESLKKGIEQIFARKGREVVDVNIRAFEMGRNFRSR